VRWVQARQDIEPDEKQVVWWSKKEVDDFKEKSRTVCKLFRKFQQPSRDFLRSSGIRNLCQKQNIDLHDLTTLRGFETRLCQNRSQKRKDALKEIVSHQYAAGTDNISLSKLSQQSSNAARAEAVQTGLRDEEEARLLRSQKPSIQHHKASKRKIDLLSSDRVPGCLQRGNFSVNPSPKDVLEMNYDDTPKAVWQRQKASNAIQGNESCITIAASAQATATRYNTD
jgi:hypothetical protein